MKTTDRMDWHLKDIIRTTGAEVDYPSEVDVEHELSLKRIFSVYPSYTKQGSVGSL